MATPLPNLADLQSVAADIKNTLGSAISELTVELRSVTARLTETEKSSATQATAIRQLQRSTDSHTAHLIEINRYLEDLDNRGRRHNIRLRGLPETVEPPALVPALTAIFNDLLERPADTPVEFERAHRALRPRGGESDPPRDVVACLVSYPVKEAILRKARTRDRIAYEGSEVKLFQDLSAITLQHRRALRPLLESLCTRGITYRWRFPFCLSASFRGRSAALRTPEDLPAFCEAMDVPVIDLPDWYSSFYAPEPWVPVTSSSTPKAQRNRHRRHQSHSSATPGRSREEHRVSPLRSPSQRRERLDL